MGDLTPEELVKVRSLIADAPGPEPEPAPDVPAPAEEEAATAEPVVQ